MSRILSLAVLGLALVAVPVAVGATLAPTVAHAKKNKDDGGIPLAIQVLDPEGNPITTAKVRNPQEKEPHSVRTNDGTWEGDVLYLPDGTEVFFEKGMKLTFEVSAPGYKNRKITYEMRRRKNRVEVMLEKLEIDVGFEDDEPVIQFGRDKPIGGRPIE